MAFEPKTEAGKDAIKQGADPAVVEEQEAAGELVDVIEPAAEHVEKKSEEGESRNTDDKGQDGEEEPEASDDDKDEDDPVKNPDRTPTSMPVWKHKELLKKEEERIRAEAQTELEKALAEAATKKGGSTSEDVTKLAEEFNLAPDVAEAMLSKMATIVEDRLGLVGIKKDIDAGKEAQRQAAEEQGFKTELSASDTQEALKTVAGDRPVTQEVVDKIKQLAYSTTYAKYRLTDIIKLNSDSLFGTERKPAKTAESGKGGASRGASAPKSLDEVSPADIENMSPQEFAEFSDKLGGAGSRFTRTSGPAKGKS